MNERLRQSGRSSRLLQYASELCMASRYVFVVTGSMRERDRLRVEFARQFGGMVAGENKIYYAGGSCSFESSTDIDFDFDWVTLRPCGCHPSCVVLVDHLAIEEFLGKFSKAIDEMHRYDSNSRPFREEDFRDIGPRKRAYAGQIL